MNRTRCLAAREAAGLGKGAKAYNTSAAALREWCQSLPALVHKMTFLAWENRGVHPVIMVQTSPSGVDKSDPLVTMIPRSSWEELDIGGSRGFGAAPNAAAVSADLPFSPVQRKLMSELFDAADFHPDKKFMTYFHCRHPGTEGWPVDFHEMYFLENMVEAVLVEPGLTAIGCSA